ncbi:MAG: hypothetical protein KatS3mg057_1061 [Herpetosiphonaceae bacterium]|nr:MAG: hypothetical protein KatS3mg057_1061 [Herpetosiphonaceae bacterium]
MQHCGMHFEELKPQERAFYSTVLNLLNRSGIPYLVGGAYAFACYTGIVRHTKDIDIFVRPDDVIRTLHILDDAGYKTEFTFSHWLGKAYNGENFIDIIFGSGNGIAIVDDLWFEHAVPDTMMEIPVKLCPPEEIIWSKALIMERERYDGADVAHLLRAQAERIDWQRLLMRLGSFWRVLLSHLVLFGFIYPSERQRIPQWVMDELLERLRKEMEMPSPQEKICQGTLISREQYLPDIEQLGYKDARLSLGTMTQAQIANWTADIEEHER